MASGNVRKGEGVRNENVTLMGGGGEEEKSTISIPIPENIAVLRRKCTRNPLICALLKVVTRA